jgi:hypothetical protein
MTIKQQGGIFGRNPKFNDVEVDGVLDANVINTVDVNASNEITAKSQTITDTSGAVIRLSRNDPSLTTNDRIGGIEFYQNDPSGSGVGVVAGIFCENESSFSGLGSIVFKVGDASSYAEVARFKSSGNLALNNGNGIDFSATSGTGTSELFDDYEEGTWTPVFSDANSGGNTAGGSNIYASYTKVGRIVNVYLQGQSINTSGMTAGNSLFIQGLPYTSSSTNEVGRSVGNARLSNVSFDDYVVLYLASGKTFFSLTSVSSAGAASSVLISDLTSGSADIRLHLTYQTD